MLNLIEQTNFCTLQCQSCPNRLNQRKKGYMTNTMFRNIIDQLDMMRYERMALHGFGDVFLNPDFFDNLDYLCRKSFCRVDFSINGLLLTDDIINTLKEFSCLSFICISLNSAQKPAMEHINTGSDFWLVVDNIKKLIASKPHYQVHIQFMRCRETAQEKAEDIKEVIGAGNYIITEKVLHDYSGQMKDGISNIKRVDCLCGDIPVFAPMYMMHWDGDLVGCCGDDTKKQVYGNALEDGIFSKKVQDRRHKLAQDLIKGDYSELPLCKGCRNA